MTIHSSDEKFQFIQSEHTRHYDTVLQKLSTLFMSTRFRKEARLQNDMKMIKKEMIFGTVSFEEIVELEIVELEVEKELSALHRA